jgi:hypothetical protein
MEVGENGGEGDEASEHFIIGPAGNQTGRQAGLRMDQLGVFVNTHSFGAWCLKHGVWSIIVHILSLAYLDVHSCDGVSAKYYLITTADNSTDGTSKHQSSCHSPQSIL